MFSSIYLYAQDTLNYESNEVVIEANTIFSDAHLDHLLVSKIILDDTWQKNESLSDILTLQPGLSIKDYGGIGGMKTISVRGTSSNQTTFLLDGMRLNPSQNGIADLNIIPMSLIDNIEVVRGGASALFGANAIGGVVNLNTNFPKTERYYLNSEIREFGEKIFSTGFTRFSDYIAFSIDLNYVDSEGDYPLQYKFLSETKEVTRSNGDYEKLTISPLLQIKRESSHYVLRTILNRSWQGVPGAVLSGHIESSKSRLDKDELIVLQKYSSIFSEDVLIDIGLLLNYNTFNFSDQNLKNFGPNGLIADFENLDLSSKASYSSKLIGFDNRLSVEIGYSSLKGDQLDPTVNDDVDRISFALSEIVEKDFDKTSLLAGLRFDYYSDAGNAFSPLISINRNEDIYIIGLQYSYNFRPPSFNEMYYLNYGTSDLKPERSHSLNLGFNILPVEHLMISWNMFYINTEDQIIAVPLSPVTWRAANAAEVRNLGLELLATWNDIFDIFDVNFNYTRQDVRDISSGNSENNLVAYIPQELISSVISAEIGDLDIGITAHYSSFRYALADNSVESVIPDYLVVDLKTSYTFNIFDTNLSLYAVAKNIFDEEYSIVMNYPMPGRYFVMGLNYVIEESDE